MAKLPSIYGSNQSQCVTGIKLGSTSATTQTGVVTITPSSISAQVAGSYASSSHTHSNYALTSHTHSNYSPYYPRYNLAVRLSQLSGSDGRLKIYKTPCAGYLFITPSYGFKHSDGDVIFAAGTLTALQEEKGNTQENNRIIIVGMITNGYERFAVISPLMGSGVYFRNVNGSGTEYQDYNYWFIPAVTASILETDFDISTRSAVFDRAYNFSGSPSLLGSL